MGARRVRLEHGGVADIEGLRDLDHRLRLDPDALGPVGTAQADDLVSRRQAAGRAPGRDDAPGALDAHDRGQFRGPGIAALDGQQVGGVDGRGLDLDHHLVVGRRAGVVDLDAGADRVRAAVF